MEINLPFYYSTFAIFMERELFLPIKEISFTRERVNAEISVFKKILPFIESYQSFSATHEIFDLQKHHKLKRKKSKLTIYNNGFEQSNRYFAICKN